MLKYLTLLLALIAFPAIGPAYGQSTLGGGTVGIPGLTTNAVRERHLKAVDAPADEECLTYEDTVGDFEWQSCIAGAMVDLVDDTTPQLGGPLDVNGKEITGSIDIHSDDDVILELGDNAGVNKVIINDSDGTEVANINSDGEIEGTHLHVTDTAVAPGDHAAEIDIDGGGVGDVSAIHIGQTTGNIGDGDDQAVMSISIDDTGASGGEIFGTVYQTINGGSADVTAIKVAEELDVIRQLSGTFGDMDSFLILAVDDLTDALSAAPADVIFFLANNDTITIADAAKFDGISFVLSSGASGGGIKPKYEFWNGSIWVAFTPIDGTSKFKHTGSVTWDLLDIPTWALDGNTEYAIQVTREQVAVTPPIGSQIQIAASNVFGWSKAGVLDVAEVNADGIITAIGGLSVGNNVFVGPTDNQLVTIENTFPASTGSTWNVISSAGVLKTSANTATAYTFFGEIFLDNDSTVDTENLIGFESNIYGNVGGTIANGIGFRSDTFSTWGATATFTNAYGFYASTPGDGNTTIENAYGLYVGDHSSAATTINEAIHVDGGDINLAASGQYLAPSGTVGAPSYADTGDRTSGLYYPAANEVGLVAGGVEGYHQTTTEILPLLPINMADRVISRAIFKDTAEKTNAIGDTGGGPLNIDLEAGQVITLTQTVSQTTLSFINPVASDEGMSFTIICTDCGSNGGLIFPGSVTWMTPNGVTPTLPTSGVVLLSFFKTDVGATGWFGFANGRTRELIFSSHAKIGATPGWVLGAANDLAYLATIPASQTDSTFIVPISGIEVGETITEFCIVGQIESAGNAVTIEGNLRVLTAAAADISDASVSTVTTGSQTAQYLINDCTSGITQTVASGQTYYVVVKGNTGASTDAAMIGTTVTLFRN